ncbi:MAG: hypothetical protein AB8U88_03820 [Rickettsia conorii subsp. raoultii]|uniref:Uncharacterized protein n=1 Tax=Rickettsia conorii subsp. raoultii TaxID=369822 RepID=A0ABY4U501_RICCR|nr:hypothetical protein [Rickettsia conorii]URW78424.1 hypothetical protein NBT09_03710 [Rickettsia conorii subsp. raoultii]
MKDIAKDYYEYWFGRGKGCLKGATTYLNDLEYALSAFALHQSYGKSLQYYFISFLKLQT